MTPDPLRETLKALRGRVEALHVWNDGPQYFIDGAEDMRTRALAEIDAALTDRETPPAQETRDTPESSKGFGLEG